MTLTIKERFLILNLLPREDNITNIRTIRKLREALSLSDAEQERYKPVFGESGGVTWDGTQPQEAEVEIVPLAIPIVQKALKKLNDENKLAEEHLSIWDKFVGE